MVLRSNESFQDLVGCFHGHATEVRNKVGTLSMASKATFCKKTQIYVRSGIEKCPSAIRKTYLYSA
jgi:hypothetical protein